MESEKNGESWITFGNAGENKAVCKLESLQRQLQPISDKHAAVVANSVNECINKTAG